MPVSPTLQSVTLAWTTHVHASALQGTCSKLKVTANYTDSANKAQVWGLQTSFNNGVTSPFIAADSTLGAAVKQQVYAWAESFFGLTQAQIDALISETVQSGMVVQ